MHFWICNDFIQFSSNNHSTITKIIRFVGHCSVEKRSDNFSWVITWPRTISKHVHGGMIFGPRPPLPRDGKCVPMQFWSTDLRSEIWWSPDLFSSNMQFWSSSDSRFSSKNLNVDQNCIFEENKSGDHQISERKSVEQNCISTNLPSRERGGRGPKIIPPCIGLFTPPAF